MFFGSCLHLQFLLPAALHCWKPTVSVFPNVFVNTCHCKRGKKKLFAKRRYAKGNDDCWKHVIIYMVKLFVCSFLKLNSILLEFDGFCINSFAKALQISEEDPYVYMYTNIHG